MTPVAEVAFEIHGNDGVQRGVARVAQPCPDQDDWRCEYQVEWPGSVKARYAMGVDSWQALALAMQSVATEIFISDDFKAGRVREFGRPLRDYDELTEWLGVRPIKVLQQ
jgi:hypothetical protein